MLADRNAFDFILHRLTLPKRRVFNQNMLTEEDIKSALKSVKYPGYSRDIISFGLVKQIAAKNGAVSVSIQLTGGGPEVARQIKTESETALKALPGVQNIYVEVKGQPGT